MCLPSLYYKNISLIIFLSSVNYVFISLLPYSLIFFPSFLLRHLSIFFFLFHYSINSCFLFSSFFLHLFSFIFVFLFPFFLGLSLTALFPWLPILVFLSFFLVDSVFFASWHWPPDSLAALTNSISQPSSFSFLLNFFSLFVHVLYSLDMLLSFVFQLFFFTYSL